MTQKIYAALIKAKAEFKPVIFDKVNPHFKAKFASLKAIEDATHEALAKNGLTIIQPWAYLENGDTVIITSIIHESGEHLDSRVILSRGNKTDQQFGASVTYMRRYQAASLLGVVGEEDDDGESDQGRVSPPQEYKKSAPVDSSGAFITEKQGKMFFAITKDFPEYREIVRKRYVSTDKIPYADFQKVLEHFESYKKSKTPVQATPSESLLPASLTGEEECPF